MPKDKTPSAGAFRWIRGQDVVGSPVDPETTNDETVQGREVETHGRVGR